LALLAPTLSSKHVHLPSSNTARHCSTIVYKPIAEMLVVGALSLKLSCQKNGIFLMFFILCQPIPPPERENYLVPSLKDKNTKYPPNYHHLIRHSTTQWHSRLSSNTEYHIVDQSVYFINLDRHPVKDVRPIIAWLFTFAILPQSPFLHKSGDKYSKLLPFPRSTSKFLASQITVNGLA